MIMVHKIKVGSNVYTREGYGRITGIVKAKYSYVSFPSGFEFNKGTTVYRVAIPPKGSKVVVDMRRKDILRVDG